MFQQQIQETRPLTTAHLAQTMALLHMTIEEIQQSIEKELSSNPALELKEERRCPTCQRLLGEHEPCPVCSRPQNISEDEPVVFISPRDDFSPRTDSYAEEYPDERDLSPTVDDLPTYVLRQIALELPAQDRPLVAYMLAHLDDDGFLTIDLVEIAMYFHVPLSKIQQLKRMIQRADPLGVCSSSPQEAMLVQLELLAETIAVPNFAYEIIKDGMAFLTKRQFNELAHQFNTSLSNIQDAVSYISDNLNPFPGRSHWGDVRDPVKVSVEVFHRPDIIIGHINDDPEMPLAVEIIMPIGGTLRVNPLFRKAIKKAPTEQKETWKQDIDRASLFVKCLQQRNHTMKRLMYNLVKIQKDFILQGPKYIQPITRVQLSRVLEVHESTISRAVSNKTVQLPNKHIIPMADFFDRSLNVRTVLREIIAKETKPLSDAKLVKLLSVKGYDVARRTVAKYRAMEGILPAHLRNLPNQTS
jgi:RNA polymerase sigma-54 factor